MQESQRPSFTDGYEELTLWQRLLGVIYAPRAAFRAVGEQSSSLDWFVPVVILCSVWTGSNYYTLPVLANSELPAYQEKYQELPPQQQEMTKIGLERYRNFGWYTMPFINSFFALAAVGLILLAMGKFVFQSEVTLRQMMTVKGYGSVIAVIELIVRTPIIIKVQTAEVSFSLGAMFDVAGDTAFGRILLAAELFDLWQVIVLGIGLGTMAKVGLNRTVPSMIVLWALWVTSGALLSSFATAPPPATG